MKKLWTNYCGAILVCSVVFFGILALNARYNYLNQNEMELERNNTIVALGD